MHTFLRFVRRTVAPALVVGLIVGWSAESAAAGAAPAKPTIRIKTGITKPLTDETGTHDLPLAGLRASAAVLFVRQILSSIRLTHRARGRCWTAADVL